MARRKIIPDTDVYAEIRRMIVRDGERAVSFQTVARAIGLAAPTLVQRFGTREAMVHGALAAGWEALEAATDTAEADAPLNAKGAQAFLKALGADTPEAADLSHLAADFRDPVLRERADRWRQRVETAIALRLGGGAKAQEAAALLFAAWQGQRLWQPAGGKGFRLKDAVKRLSG